MSEIKKYNIGDIPDHERILWTDSKQPILVDYSDKERSLRDYSAIFGLTEDDINNKSILDLGSSRNQLFASEVKKDPRLSPEKIVCLDPLAEQKAEDVMVVAGLAEKLPFANDSFDLILCCNSIPMYLRTREAITDAFSETIHVLKPSGRAEFFPLAYTPSGEGYDLTEKKIWPTKPTLYAENPSFFDDIIAELKLANDDSVRFSVVNVAPRADNRAEIDKLVINK